MYDFIVPQELNIADRIGKFTFTQLAILSVGVLTVLILFSSSSLPLLVNFLIGGPTLMLSLTFAFVRRYDMPIYEFLITYFMFRIEPKEMAYGSPLLENEYVLDEIENENEELLFT